MVTAAAHPSLAQALSLADGALRTGDPAGARRLLEPLLSGFGGDPRLLHMLGLAAMHAQEFEAAASYFAKARIADPEAAALAFSHGTALRWLERHSDAVEAYKAATALKPDHAEAWYETAASLHQLGRTEEAEIVLRQWLAAMPGFPRAQLALADLLLALGRPQEAEAALRAALADPRGAMLHGLLQQRLGLALRRQHRNEDSLAAYDRAAALDGDPMNQAVRAEILQDLKRYDEAERATRMLVAREPGNPKWHKLHNDLMYRLGREDYLKSYDRAPRTAELLLSKAYFLSHEKRGAEAYEAYAEALKLDPESRDAAIGIGNALNLMKRHSEALQSFEAVMARHGEDADLLSCAAEAAILGGDPQKSAALCEKSVRLAPFDQVALALLGTAWRLQGDEREEELNRYDSLIQVYDLEPPEGFSDMDSFNAELNHWLDRMHPATREYLDQSLRNGTQTPDRMFGAGHDLVERLERRIREALGRYIAGLKADASHPFLSRRGRDFGYTGSWSSRLRDCGFHTNHVHPEGWISSCYYVALPDAVADETARQGWIKFGEPALDVKLKDPIRRAIQPRPGRLVLFPSYMWHGTIPFRDTQPRTTIAFDAVPKV
jgi:tetratricopeptide (TPR) repeat protein